MIINKKSCVIAGLILAFIFFVGVFIVRPLVIVRNDHAAAASEWEAILAETEVERAAEEAERAAARVIVIPPITGTPTPRGPLPNIAQPVANASAPDPSDDPNDIPLTRIERPAPPPLPETAQRTEPLGTEDNPVEINLDEIDLDDPTADGRPEGAPTDPVLLNPDVRPDQAQTPIATPAPVTTTQPGGGNPSDGDTDGRGNVYIPGFGWVPDEGGGSTIIESAGGGGDWDKIIGY